MQTEGWTWGLTCKAQAPLNPAVPDMPGRWVYDFADDSEAVVNVFMDEEGYLWWAVDELVPLLVRDDGRWRGRYEGD